MALKPGTAVTGKWSKERIVVESHLGTGANGEVYLVRCQGRRAAMKVSTEAGDIALEWGILEKLREHGRLFPEPILADDTVVGTPLYFYVMEWIPGKPFATVFRTLDPPRQLKVLRQVLVGLDHLHAAGYAFCDVKPENILVHDLPGLGVRFIDVGGVTPFHRSVRQFTPLYDRAYWQLGSRASEPAYDVAAVALLVVCSLSNQTHNAVQRMTGPERERWLQRSMSRLPIGALRPVLHEMLTGGIQTASEALDRLGPAEREAVVHVHHQAVHAVSPQGKVHPTTPPARAGSTPDWTERLMWGSLLIAFSAACFAGATVLGWV